MAHINLQNDFPGIRGLMAYRPESAAPLNELAEVLLRSENSLSRGERELIAAYVSSLNDCYFCQQVHGGMAAYYLQCDTTVIDSIKADYNAADISTKIKSLLRIAASVQQGGKQVSPEEIATAKSAGATDAEIHDTVLIAAAFCMFNRYVDGLATWAPQGQDYYTERAPRRAEEGYAHVDITQ